MEQQRPSVFIGSSQEGLPIANTMQVLLDRTCEVTVWSQGIFGLSQGNLESLVHRKDDFDFAVLVLTPDDVSVSRGDELQSPRDNVLFELGMFMGALGRDRTFIVTKRNAEIKLPTDLAGVTYVDFEIHRTGDLTPSLGAACTQIQTSINRLGIREQERYSHLSRATKEVEQTNDRMNDMIRLLTRSRKVELEIISGQFGPLISPELLIQMKKDLNDLEKTLEQDK